MGNAGVPGAAISFGIASYDCVTDFAQGNIGGRELAYDLGGNALGVTGSIIGSGLATAAVDSVVPGVGTVGGFAVGVVGGMVGYAVTTEAYQTAVKYGSEGASILADKAKVFASDTPEQVRAEEPEKVAQGKWKVAAKVVTATVSGVVTLTLGEIGIAVFESIFMGDLDINNTDWDKVVERIIKDKSFTERLKKIKGAIKNKDGDSLVDELIEMIGKVNIIK